jgi:HEAT repeats
MNQIVDLDRALDQTRDPDPRTRIRALHDLCPCQLKADYPEVWDRVLVMVGDEDARVRGHVLHVLGDGSPRHREAEVVGAVERLGQDADPGLRRRARKLLAHYRRTGKINAL